MPIQHKRFSGVHSFAAAGLQNSPATWNGSWSIYASSHSQFSRRPPTRSPLKPAGNLAGRGNGAPIASSTRQPHPERARFVRKECAPAPIGLDHQVGSASGLRTAPTQP